MAKGNEYQQLIKQKSMKKKIDSGQNIRPSPVASAPAPKVLISRIFINGQEIILPKNGYEAFLEFLYKIASQPSLLSEVSREDIIAANFEDINAANSQLAKKKEIASLVDGTQPGKSAEELLDVYEGRKISCSRTSRRWRAKSRWLLQRRRKSGP